MISNDIRRLEFHASLHFEAGDYDRVFYIHSKDVTLLQPYTVMQRSSVQITSQQLFDRLLPAPDPLLRPLRSGVGCEVGTWLGTWSSSRE